MDETSRSRRWVVTGASRGIGLALAQRVVAGGDRVALVARGPAVVDVAAALGPRAMGVQADVRSAQSIAGAIGQIADAWKGVDVLVNNAGLHRGGLVSRMDPADFEDVYRTNVAGPFQLIRACLEHMPKGGSIVNVGAVVGFRGFAGDSAYGSAKAGLAGLTQVLAVELAHSGIRVNLVVPGMVPTEMTSEISEKARQMLVRRIPMRREGKAEEIAKVIWWVAGSTYMTGAVVATDGGLMAAL